MKRAARIDKEKRFILGNIYPITSFFKKMNLCGCYFINGMITSGLKEMFSGKKFKKRKTFSFAS